jgi:hypothetical protein
MMRWMTQDPLGYVDGMNDYGFVKEDPINGIDPQGTETEDDGDETPKTLNEQVLLKTFDIMKASPNKLIGEIGESGITATEGVKTVGDTVEYFKAMNALRKAFTNINNPEEAAENLTEAYAYIGQEAVKDIMKKVATKAGEGLGFAEGAGEIYAAVLIDAWKTGDAIGQTAANMLDDGFVQNVWTAADNNENLKNGSMIYQSGAVGGGTSHLSLYVFKDLQGQIWVRRPVVHGNLAIVIRSILFLKQDYEWVHP